MHLKQLKLAGFKSFVDPTVVPFSSQLVGVVGPNGCGKSNVIDAVRWVMGESSAKTLRGESMTDVIFNGSSHRKPVGQASVEMIFDNSLGRFAGQFASYQEISVKRIVTRDGDSSYYLNGSRCRRRDITDIFLGTGAGARGYSIIGQGTISRLVEARPEELRAYLEEAAGISKYKERRRETVSRIEQTRDNLTRIVDIREELAKQLQRLERQAKAAERYNILKQQEHQCKVDILALKWKDLTQEQNKKKLELQQLIIEYEKYQAHAAEAYKKSTTAREKIHDDTEKLQQLQADFYQMAAEIARLEENIHQQQREKQRLKNDQQQIKMDWQHATEQLKQDRERLQESERLHLDLQSSLQTIQSSFKLKQQALQENQALQADLNRKTQQNQAHLSKLRNEKKITELHLQHFAERRQQILSRLEKINDELRTIDAEPVDEILKLQQSKLPELHQAVQIAENKHQEMTALSLNSREQLADTEQLLHQAQDKEHRLSTRQSSLLAAQRIALGQVSEQAIAIQWTDKPRLVEQIKVEKNWQFACEIVLAQGLQAVVLDSLTPLWADPPSGSMVFLSANQPQENKALYPRLSEKISGLTPNWVYPLEKIYTASTLDDALVCLDKLMADESVITIDGHWLGKGWVKFAGKEKQEDHSLLARQDELIKLKEMLGEAEGELATLKTHRDYLHQQIKEQEQQADKLKDDLSQSRHHLKVTEAEIIHQERALDHAKTRKSTLETELEELRFNLEELAGQQEHTEQLLSQANITIEQAANEQQFLESARISGEQTLQNHRLALDDIRTALHQCQLDSDKEQLKIQQLNENRDREQSRLITINERLEAIMIRLDELESPDHELNELLHEKIQQHSTQEAKLNQHREQLNYLTKEVESWDILIKIEEKQAKIVQEKIQQEQMQAQALAVRAEGILETITEFNEQIDDLLAAIPADVSQDLRARELQDIVDKIKRLGSINLAAIEEYDSELQRKLYLDEQYNDLTTALATLDAAIEKMDKETHQRLGLTFDKVNTAFQALFPRLFGGGHARLELTCDNLLEAGVLVMAQPPGKRNSTIHLLSGGEKAMTAVALVFAIFQLNPSPFCMLDEVDAPLDDVNVGRFCELVNDMSQFVQFLFITHNKVTMGLAEHLIGVTMREPGVSKIVAVDVEQALAMCED